MSYPVTAVLTATALAAGARLARSEPVTPALFLGGGVAALVLSLAAGPLPALVQALSTIIIVASILTNGYTLAVPVARIFS